MAKTYATKLPPKEYKFCPSCGQKNLKTSKYCMACGFEIPEGNVNNHRDSQSRTNYSNTSSPSYLFAPPTKSYLTAFVLTLFLGPIGLFYSTITGGIIMLIIYSSVLYLTFATVSAGYAAMVLFGGVIWAILQLICVTWSLICVSIKNRKILRKYYDK